MEKEKAALTATSPTNAPISNDFTAQIADRPNEASDMAFDHPWQPPESPPTTVDDRTAAIMFKKMLRKFEQVRNVSSPVLKLITIHRLMNEVMAAVNDAQSQGGPHEADNLIEIIFYLLVQLQSNEAKFLGARFVEECTYIDSFIHEDQIGLIEEYANIEHMQVVLT